jgi:hypothetical protein
VSSSSISIQHRVLPGFNPGPRFLSLNTIAFLASALLCLPALPTLAQAPAPKPPASCFALVADDGHRRDVCIHQATFNADTCIAIEIFARTFGLPPAYFARLVWQESRFDPSAVSTAGAQGIAQFMPETGRLQGLGNAFDPAEALARSAAYLAWLDEKFGNLGLAAAAYNAGEGRLTRVTQVGGFVPSETRDYVAIITGQSIEHWLSGPAPAVDYTLAPGKSFYDACLEMARARPMPQMLASADWQPWGVLLAQDFSPQKVQDRFERLRSRFGDVIGDEPMLLLKVRNPNFGRKLRYSAMIGRQTRKEADALCRRLASAGAACLVQKNK